MAKTKAPPSNYRRRCPLCGEWFTAHTAAAIYCQACRKAAKTLHGPPPYQPQAVCTDCGKTFSYDLRYHQRSLARCQDCSLTTDCQTPNAHTTTTTKAPTPKKTTHPAKNDRYDNPAKRTCHDCGRPTNNYRCPDCWKAFRERYGISAIDDYEGL